MRKHYYNLQLFAGNAAGTVVNYSGNGTAANAGTYNTVADTAVSTGDLSVEMKTFYDKTLLTLVGPKLVHEQFGQKRPIPRNGGRTIEFRGFKPLAKALTPITEGVTPAGRKLVAYNKTADIEQFGDYIEQTDLLEMTAIDNTIVEATKALADQAGRTMDTIVRNELVTGNQVYFVPKRSGGTETEVTSMTAIDATCLLHVKDVFRVAAFLKKNNAPTINGDYVAIIHPYVAYDLMQEAGDVWMDVHKYTTPENIFRGEIGKLGGVRFVETTEAYIYNDILGVVDSSADANSKTTVTLKENLAKAVSDGDKVYIDGHEVEIDADAAATGKTFTLTTTTTYASKGAIVTVTNSRPVFSTLFLGSGAYAITDIAGGGIEHIVKQRGYGNDPLNQRSSIGWKGIKTVKILIDEYMYRVESASSLGGFDIVAD